MKILHVVEAFSSGIFTYLQSLVSGVSNECEAYILYGRRPETPEHPEELFPPNTTLIFSKHLKRELDPREDLAAFLEIRKTVLKIKPDVVHLHSSKAGALGRWAVSGRRTRLFYTPHGYSFLTDDFSSLKKKLYFLVEKLCGYRTCITVACGKGEYEQSLQVTHRATYVNNAVDTDELDRFGLPGKAISGAVSVCTLARISRQKNPMLFNQIAHAFPDIRFIWIGDGEMRNELTSPNIEITGWLPKEEAMVKLQESAVFLLPSLWEGLPLSLLEAMYLKRICIVSAIPANSYIIEDGRTGYVCQTLDDYVFALKKTLAGYSNSSISEAARQEIRIHYSCDIFAKQYLSLYQGTQENN